MEHLPGLRVVFEPSEFLEGCIPLDAEHGIREPNGNFFQILLSKHNRWKEISRKVEQSMFGGAFLLSQLHMSYPVNSAAPRPNHHEDLRYILHDGSIQVILAALPKTHPWWCSSRAIQDILTTTIVAGVSSSATTIYQARWCLERPSFIAQMPEGLHRDFCMNRATLNMLEPADQNGFV